MTTNSERVDALVATEARRTAFRNGVLVWARDDIGADVPAQLELIALADDLYDHTDKPLAEIAAELSEAATACAPPRNVAAKPPAPVEDRGEEFVSKSRATLRTPAQIAELNRAARRRLGIRS